MSLFVEYFTVFLDFVKCWPELLLPLPLVSPDLLLTTSCLVTISSLHPAPTPLYVYLRSCTRSYLYDNYIYVHYELHSLGYLLAYSLLQAMSAPAAHPSQPASYYFKCMLGGILSCGLTHLVVTPLDVIKCRMQVCSKIVVIQHAICLQYFRIF